MNPRATILIPASKQKIPMKYGSVFSCRCRAEVLVRGGRVSQTQAEAHPATQPTLTYPLLPDTRTSAPVQVGREGAGGLREGTEREKPRGPAAETMGAGSHPGPDCFPWSWPMVLALPPRRWLFHAGLRARRMPQRSHP